MNALSPGVIAPAPHPDAKQRRDRIWRLLQLRSQLQTETGCLVWQGGGGGPGYGRLHGVLAHYAAYAAAVGEIPFGARVVRSCRSRDCISPEHLALETSQSRERVVSRSGERPFTSKSAGGTNARAKLTQDQVRAIRASSVSVNELAALFGVARSTINRVKSRAGWKAV